MEFVEQGKYIVLTSDLIRDELTEAPEHVRSFVKSLPEHVFEFCHLDDEAIILAQKYIDAGALTGKSLNDARHVAVATVHNADCIVSCNFKHLVNRVRIAKFNGVNSLAGYQAIDIKKPEEVIDYDE